ncbi:PQQ-binding-like beta-propeller repeat protein [Streptomyces formicae]|uniref:PQQ-binding-like beta-propeller repeat protein n=1 Tax=Streptomyces formicae TaxID=1616117 RepID=A0ABY3WFF2_9ACTN|nr:PQQ-binding-like beta-propeller repeat protein [Streptomyces formicae]UNM11299.1 PQQ-binding-like beta-propeller repeat protein [Streptomyces formicae]
MEPLPLPLPEPLRGEDPRRIGPYAALARFRETAGTVQYVARGDDADDTAAVVVSLARAELAALPAFRRRFEAEARTAERLAGGWVLAPVRTGTDGPGPWTAHAYVPAVTLGEAIALAGPLHERAVRILGAGLAETLSRVHATGTVLHGLAPETVLLAADGPRLAAFGALGAAASAEAAPGGGLSVRLGYLTPEQLAGDKPGTASDVFVLGLLLAYASTGTNPFPDGPAIADAEPELDGVPEGLRDLLASCLAKSPAARPTAGTAAATLALEGAAALAKDGWLPDALLRALSARADAVSHLVRPQADALPDRPTPRPTATATVTATATPPAPAPPAGHGRTTLALRTDAGPVAEDAPAPAPAPPRAPAAPAGAPAFGAAAGRSRDKATAALGIPRSRPAGEAVAPSAGGEDGGKSPLTASVLAARAGAERRVVVTAGVAGAVGLVVGGGLGVALSGGGETAAPAKARPAAKPLPGVPPVPRWAYRHPAQGVLRAAAWRDRVVVVGDAKQCTGVDLRTGRRLWTQTAAASAHGPVVAGDAVFVVGVTHFVWLSPKDGSVLHRIAAPAHVSAVTAAEGPVVWFTGTAGSGTYLFAYDTAARKELWRAQVPGGRAPGVVPRYQGVAVRPDGILVRQDGASLTPQQVKANRGRALFSLYDRVGGKLLWSRYFGTVLQDAPVSGDPSTTLYAAASDGLYAYDTRSGTQLWRAGGASGEGVVRDGTVYVPTAGHQLYALDAATGAARWAQSTEAGSDPAPAAGERSRVLLSAGGRTALVLESTQVTAFSTADGTRLWKFQDAGGRTAVPGYRALVAGSTAVVWRDRAFYALSLG